MRSNPFAAAGWLATFAVSAFLAGPAGAEPGAGAAAKPGPERLRREVLMELGRPEDASWLRLLEGSLRLEGSGLEWRRHLVAGHTPVVLKLGGPVVKHGYGLRVELEF